MEGVSGGSSYSAVNAGCHQRVLEVVGGNPLATRGNPERSPPHLSLVWQQEGTLAKQKLKRERNTQQTVSQKDLPLTWYRKGWQWLGDNGPAIQSVAIIGGIVWFMATIHSRLGQLEGGLAGISSNVATMSEKLIRIEAKQEIVDKYLLPQIFGSKAEALLGTPDVGIFNIVHNEVTTDARFSTPYKDPLPSPSPQKQVFITYTFEGIRNGFFFIRAQIEEEEGGKVVRTLYDRRVQVGLPTEVGKSDETCFKFVNNENKAETPPVCIKVVLLERVGPDNLVFASAVRQEGAS